MGYFGNPYQPQPMGYNPYGGYAPTSPQNGAGAMQGFAGQITRVNGENGVDGPAQRIDRNGYLSVGCPDRLVCQNR